MSLFQEHDARFEGLERRTGLFLLVAALLISAAVVATLVRQGAFTQTSRLQFFANTAQGIDKGMAVQLFGFKIGTVDTVTLEPDGSVMVRLAVQTEHLRLINREAVARIGKEGLIGAAVVEIVPGRASSGPIAENGLLKFERAADFSSMAEGLTAEVRPILADIKQITESVNRPDGDVRVALRNMRQMTAEFTEAARQWSKLAANADRQLAGVLAKADQAMDKVDATFAKAESTVDTLDRKLPELTLKLDRTLANLEAASADARRLTSGALEDVPPALRDARVLAKDGRAMLDGAKRSWPFNTMVAEPREQALPLDSFDGAAR
jgi:phospholipid/cholesterol/gamma-HCH transport system substrate-binding protein